MSEISVKIKIEPDSDGYVTFDCPFCNFDFGLKGAEFQCDNPIYSEMHCPYCGLSDKPSKFYTKEVMEQIKAVTMNYINEELKNVFGKISKRMNKNGLLKMTYTPMKSQKIKVLKTDDSIHKIFECKNCNNHVKVLYCKGVSKIFCSFCGDYI